MTAEILLAAMVLAVGLLILADLLKTPPEDPGRQASWQLDAAGRMAAAARHGGTASAMPGGPAATRTTAAARGAGARRAAPGRHARAALSSWPVHPYLLLLAAITAIAAVTDTLCARSIAGSLGGASIHSPAGGIRDEAIRTAIIAGVLAAAVTALALWAAGVVTRTMLQPVHRLRASTADAAGTQLPDAVRLIRERGGDTAPGEVEAEPVGLDAPGAIADVARAFDQVYGQALRLAVSEAATRGNLHAMLANLSHRVGHLADRQRQLIGDIEQGEAGAAQMARLHRLDRLAARMGRFSQNLLIVAGHEISGPWNQAMTLADVINLAVSQVEDYERVSLAVDAGIIARAPAVNDLVHLLAELTENATSLSADHTPVIISGYWLATGGVLIRITDQGFGMSADEIAHANWRLEHPPLEIAAYRSLGLFVTARLARRHGIQVRLQPADSGGLTALVWLPEQIIMQHGAAASPYPAGYGGVRAGPGE